MIAVRWTDRRVIAMAGAAALLAIAGTSCGSDARASDATVARVATSLPTTPSTAPATVPSTDVVASGDAALAEQALLIGSDVGEGWGIADDRLAFPNSAELARTVPECADFAELVFDGGKQSGAGLSRALFADDGLLFTYAVVFPTVDEAAAMVAAASTPEFDKCWAGFNAVAATSMPVGIQSASYESKPPPALTFTADSSTVKFLDGIVKIGGTDLRDTCVCVFAQVGRGVVEVHSVESVFDPEERSKVVQAAIDRLRSTLG